MILDFIFKPNPNLEKNSSLISKIKELLFVIVCLFISIYCFGFIEILLDLFIKESYGFSIREIINSSQNEFLKYKYSLLIILIFPLIEELIFRLPLNLKINNIFISILGLNLLTIYFNILLTILFYLIIFYLFIKKRQVFSKISLLIKKKYGYYYYFLCLLFSFLHIFNFYDSIPIKLHLVLPFYVMPQFLFALFSGYLRLRNGFLFSLLFHYLFNLPFIFKFI